MKHLQSRLSSIHSKKAIVSAALLVLTFSANAETKVEKCTNNLGTIAVHEPNGGYAHLSSYGLGSPTALLRLMIQQSGCFDVVERGAAMSNLQQERQLAARGELTQDANIGKGQMQGADFVLTANVQASGNTGGVGGAIAGVGKLFGSVGAAIGAVAGGLRFKEANTSILIADVRSGIQVAAAEGKAKKTDFSIGGWGYGAGSFGGGGGYTSTPEGKMIAASLVDNFNQIVLQIRDKAQLVRARSASSIANAASSTQMTALSDLPPPPPQPIIAAAAPAVTVVVNTPAAAPAAPVGRSKIPVEFIGEYRCMLAGPVVGRLVVMVNDKGAIAGGGTLSGTTQTTQVYGDINNMGDFMATFTNSTTGGNISGRMDNNKLTGNYKMASSKASAAETGTVECMKL